jgi:hypothetical protein
MFFSIFIEMEFEPCNYFDPSYLLEICHVMIFSSTCEMKSITYHATYLSLECNVCKTLIQPKLWFVHLQI